MKIKHWQGYGSVNYKVNKKSEKEVVIEVYGEHEWGVERDDVYDAKRWLFDRVMKNYANISAYDLKLTTNDYYDSDDIEHCTYTFTPKYYDTFKELSARS